MNFSSNFLKLLCLTLLVFANPALGQNKAPSNSGNAATIAAAGAAVAIGAISIAAAWEDWVESAELSAAEYYLKSTPGLNKPFELKLMSSQGTSFKDLSSTTTLVFTITEYEINELDNSFENPNKKLLVLFLNSGWINEYGVDFTRVIPLIFTYDEWMSIYKEYLNISGFPKIDNLSEVKVFQKVSEKDYLNETERDRHIFTQPGSAASSFFVANERVLKFNDSFRVDKNRVYTTIYTKEGNAIECLVQNRIKLNGDTFLRKEYNSTMSILYNENKLCIFLKDQKILVQLKNSVLDEIIQFFF